MWPVVINNWSPTHMYTHRHTRVYTRTHSHTCAVLACLFQCYCVSCTITTCMVWTRVFTTCCSLFWHKMNSIMECFEGWTEVGNHMRWYVLTTHWRFYNPIMWPCTERVSNKWSYLDTAGSMKIIMVCSCSTPLYVCVYQRTPIHFVAHPAKHRFYSCPLVLMDRHHSYTTGRLYLDLSHLQTV